MLGFGTLGQFSLGEFQADKTFTGSSFSQPFKRTGLAVAVVATTFAGFVPPPSKAAPVFTKFDGSLRKAAQRPDWLGTPFVVVVPPAAFSSFSQPQPARRVQTVEQPAVLFEFLPIVVPFSGFMDFGAPGFIRYGFADQQTSMLFEALPAGVPGGGTSRKLPDIERAAEPPRRKRNTGLEPVRKVRPRKVAIVEHTIALPPPSLIRPVLPIARDKAPLELVDRDLIPADLLGLQAQIQAAEDATDLQDILDIIAFLDSSGT